MKDIYIELKNYVKLPERRVILIKDVADIYCDEKIRNKIMNIPVASGENKKVLITIIDIIKMINMTYSKAKINNLGGNEIVVEFQDFKTRPKFEKYKKFIQLIFGVLLMFFGSFVAIMTFQTDVSLPVILSRLYEFLTGINEVKPIEVQLPYSLGIALGAIMFFGKFKKSKITPLEVDIDKYEKDLLESEIKMLSKEKGR